MKMSEKTLKFGGVVVNKKQYRASKKPFDLNLVDIDKIVVSDIFNISDINILLVLNILNILYN